MVLWPVSYTHLILKGSIRIKTQGEKFSALLYVDSINGFPPSEGQRRYNFEDMTPIFPNERLRMERPGGTVAMRIMDLLSPIGKGQRGMIVSPPKAGKTTLLKDVAKSILKNNPDMHLIILLIDERPEEVTDIKEEIRGSNVEDVYKRQVKVLDMIVPIMAVVYFAITILIIVMNIGSLPGVFARIFQEAFGFRQVAAGGFGAVLMNGCLLYTSQSRNDCIS